jgi:hypothetical protein
MVLTPDDRRTSVPQTHPPGGGWRDWLLSPPYQHGLVEAWRREWQRVEVLHPSGLHPAMNVAGLLWRPVSGPRLEPEVITR